MKKVIFIAVFFLIVFSAYSQSSGKGQKQGAVPSPYEPEVLKAFADSLYNDGFLSQAEGEYKRYLFSFPQGEDISYISNQTFQSSLLALTNIYNIQENTAGIEWLKDGFYWQSETLVKEKMNFVQAEFIFKERNAQKFNLFSQSIVGERKDFSPALKNLVDVSELLLNNDIGGLKAFCKGVAAHNPNYEKLNELCQSYKLKSPGLALLFSAVIPGSGKWYTGSLGAFFSSFVTIGSFVAGTVVTGIQTEWKSWQPYVFGVCGAVLYISELYGAYQSAKRYNAALFRVLCEETEKLYEKEY